MEIVKLSDHNYIHTSFMKLESGAFVPCNGFIYVNDGSAIIFDTPLNDSISRQLIDFVQEDLGAKIEGVVINHFHKDAAGGLNAFAKANIPSYASEQTANLLVRDSLEITNPFTERQTVVIKGDTIYNSYYGAAHTRDNIVSYIPSQQTIVGGCMIKSLNAGKGNLADADVTMWSETVTKIKIAYPDASLVIPGHGMYGGQELLDYTINLFQPTQDKVVGNLE
ncbi:subclass B1 metallo-beta-lactamase [Dokdonia sinensis]|nr:subclass B1 metallo-beta-lactamase [Dokdonia sinensis]